MSNEYYTPVKEIELVAKCLGGIDLDPASCESANKVVQAKKYYDINRCGLANSWKARTIFLNPPYSKELIGKFVDKFLNCMDYEHGIILVNVNSSSKWFQRLLNGASAVCFCNTRIKFINGESSARASNAYFYSGDAPEWFAFQFEKRGKILFL